MISCVIISSVMRVLYSTRCMSRRPYPALELVVVLLDVVLLDVVLLAVVLLADSGESTTASAFGSYCESMISCFALSIMVLRMGLDSPSSSSMAREASMPPWVLNSHCASSVLRGAL